MNGEAWRPVTIPPAGPARAEAPADPASIARPGLAPPRLPLVRLCRRIAAACADQSTDHAIHQTIGAILAEAAADPSLLHGVAAGPCAQRYARHLLADGAGYCLLAIVWLPGQRSPVHSHRAWCSLAVHSGVLTETRFTPTGGGLTPTGARLLHPGCGTHGRRPTATPTRSPIWVTSRRSRCTHTASDSTGSPRT